MSPGTLTTLKDGLAQVILLHRETVHAKQLLGLYCHHGGHGLSFPRFSSAARQLDGGFHPGWFMAGPAGVMKRMLRIMAMHSA